MLYWAYGRRTSPADYSSTFPPSSYCHRKVCCTVRLNGKTSSCRALIASSRRYSLRRRRREMYSYHARGLGRDRGMYGIFPSVADAFTRGATTRKRRKAGGQIEGLDSRQRQTAVIVRRSSCYARKKAKASRARVKRGVGGKKQCWGKISDVPFHAHVQRYAPPYISVFLCARGRWPRICEIVGMPRSTIGLFLPLGDLQQSVSAVERVLPRAGLPLREEAALQDKGPGQSQTDTATVGRRTAKAAVPVIPGASNRPVCV